MAAAAARSIGPVLNAVLVERKTRLGKRRAHAGAALGCTIVALGNGAEQAKAPVPEPDQVPRHRECGGTIVEADAGVLAHGIDAPGQHVGPAVVGEERKQRGIVMQADEHDRIDAAPQQLRRDAQLLLQVVVMLGQHHRVAVVVEHGLHGTGGARVESVAERRHDGATMRLRWLRRARAAPCGT